MVIRLLPRDVVEGCVPAIIRHARLNSKTFQLRSIQGQYEQFLANASLVAAKPPGNTGKPRPLTQGFFSRQPPPVTEIDGSATREFFTVLNLSALHTKASLVAYSQDQTFNIYAFSTLLPLLQAMLAGGQKVEAGLKETVCAYCFRLVEQAKLRYGDAGLVKPQLATESLPDNALCEAGSLPPLTTVRILDVLAALDSELVARVFPVVKKLLTRPGPLHIPTSISLLQFFLNHSDKVVYDPEPIFRGFFEVSMAGPPLEPLSAALLLQFFATNKARLLQTTNLFSQYFPGMPADDRSLPQNVCLVSDDLSTRVPRAPACLPLPHYLC